MARDHARHVSSLGSFSEFRPPPVGPNSQYSLQALRMSPQFVNLQPHAL